MPDQGIEKIGGETQTEEAKKIIPKTADQLDDSEIEWVIPKWIPKKGVTILGASGGTGKTYTWISLLASLSNGESSFLQYDKDIVPRNVLGFSGEDVENVLRKRIEASGADLKRFYVIAQDTTEEPIHFDSPEIERLIAEINPALVVFDPLQAFLGDRVDMSRRNQMRNAIKPLTVLASKYDCGILIIMHTNKRKAQTIETARDILADSADAWDIARSVMYCGFTEDGNRYISLEKSNFTDHSAVYSVIFSLRNGKVNFIETTKKKLIEFVREKNNGIVEAKPTKKNDCCNDILSLLAENDGAIEQKEMDAYLKTSYSDSVIRKAKENLLESGMIEKKRRANGSLQYVRKMPDE